MKNDYINLKNIFKTLSVPIEYLRYTGKEKTYATYTFTDDSPTLFGDDKEIGSVVSIDIDIFSDSNYLAIQEEIESLLEKNNYIRVGCSPDMYEEDTGLYHKTIEFEKERMR